MMKHIFKRIFTLALVLMGIELVAFQSVVQAHCGCESSHHNHWNSLIEGNREFVNSRKYAKQRKPLVKGQDPHTIILSCADSRVPPDTIFSQGLGKLFNVRSAGQVTDPVVVDSIEYAVRTFDSSLLIVMGHTDCGAVKGALEHLIRNGGVIDRSDGRHLYAVLIPIEEAIVASGMNIYAPNALEEATRVNISYIINQLIDQSPPIAEALAKKRLSIVAAVYYLDSGKVKPLYTLE